MNLGDGEIERKITNERERQGKRSRVRAKPSGRLPSRRSGTLARVAGRRVTESGSRAFLRYIKTVPCVAAAVATAAVVATAVTVVVVVIVVVAVAVTGE